MTFGVEFLAAALALLLLAASLLARDISRSRRRK
jgi:hypothetical protein